jgi:voltage-gated potassium channel
VLRDRGNDTLAAAMGATRRPVVRTIARSVLVSVAIVVLYFALPLRPDNPTAFVWLSGGLLLVVVLLVWQVRHILTASHPRLRAVEAMATTLSLFLVLFATAHYLLDENAPGSYSQTLTRVDALYFVVTTFATVGFGDIVPVTQTARVLTTAQMVADLLLVGLIVRVLLGAVQEGLRRQRRATGTDDQRAATDRTQAGDGGPDDAAGW